uniref:Uncharacterized protein n=1 Tax=Parascaris univalens TaxID=6257 RepID=A0A915BCD0_PARUN
ESQIIYYVSLLAYGCFKEFILLKRMQPQLYYILVQIWNLQCVTIICSLIFLCQGKCIRRHKSQFSAKSATKSEQSDAGMFASTKMPSMKPPGQTSSNGQNIPAPENPIEQSKEQKCAQMEKNAENKENSFKKKEAGQENIEKEQMKGNAIKNEKQISKSCRSQQKSGKESEKTLPLMKTQSFVADTLNKTSKCDENDKTKSSFDVKSLMEKDYHNMPNKGATGGIIELRSHYSIIKPISKISLATTAVEVLPKPAAKDLSGIDDLPLPLADDENPTQLSVSIKMKDDDDTGENVEELKEDVEKSSDE